MFLGQTSEDEAEQEAIAFCIENAGIAKILAKLNSSFTDLKMHACE